MTISDDDYFQKTGKQKIIITEASSENLKQLDDAITDYNIIAAKELPKAVIQRLDFTAQDSDGKLMGGIQAMVVNWGILQVDLLFVFEKYRKLGIGAQLLDYVEDRARKSGCYISHLDTFDFQAKDFYLKHGYEIFGVLENVPKDHHRYYLRKKLNRVIAQNKKEYLIEELNSDTAEKTCRAIIATLPEWFGIPEANERYALGVKDRISFGILINGQYVGMIAIETPFPNNANIYWMGIAKDYHRKGMGSALLKRAEKYCYENHFQSWTVETLSPKEKDANYLNTYSFYIKAGFSPLFELHPYGPDFAMVYLQKTIDRYS